MSSSVDMHLLYRIANAPIHTYPYPHIYVREVFPVDYYRALREHLPPDDAFRSLASLNRGRKDYDEARLVMPLSAESVQQLPEPYRAFWGELASWLVGGPFGQALLSKFFDPVAQRFGDMTQVRFYDEAMVVKDSTTYWLGPHTDAPAKVASFLFYLPPDDSMAELGTSIYVPKDPDFESAGQEHLHYDDFLKVQTMPYLPNTLFAFPKSSRSFHGVEPIHGAGVRRDLLLYDIRLAETGRRAEAQPGQAPAAAAGAPAARFTF